MNDAQPKTSEQIREFLAGTVAMAFNPVDDDADRFRFIAAVLSQFGYSSLGRPDKGLLRSYLMRTVGYSRGQAARLLSQFQLQGGLAQRYASTSPTSGRISSKLTWR